MLNNVKNIIYIFYIVVFIFLINVKKHFVSINMPEKQKVYCGMKQILPDGYDRFAIPYQCLKKGYGACLYANKMGSRYQENFFNRLPNRLGFMFFLFVLFILVLFVMNRFL